MTLSIAMLCIRLSVVMLKVVKLSIATLNVVILNVEAPTQCSTFAPLGKTLKHEPKMGMFSAAKRTSLLRKCVNLRQTKV